MSTQIRHAVIFGISIIDETLKKLLNVDDIYDWKCKHEKDCEIVGSIYDMKEGSFVIENNDYSENYIIGFILTSAFEEDGESLEECDLNFKSINYVQKLKDNLKKLGLLELAPNLYAITLIH